MTSNPGDNPSMASGYNHHLYANALKEWGNPKELVHSGGWILERKIPGSDFYDAMGCYPICSCHNWQKFHRDLDELGDRLVSLALVTDPFGNFTEEYLSGCFSDVMIKFKEHYIIELDQPRENFVSKHHRYYARKSSQDVSIEVCNNVLDHLDDWIALYDVLIQRHNIKGIKAFSRESFEKQLRIPGLVMLRAKYKETTIGAQLWFLQGNVGFNHLTAVSDKGYELNASYALHWSSIEHFSGKVKCLDLGGGAGIKSGSGDGLAHFKKGWSTSTRTAYFCGRILNPDNYAKLVKMKRIPQTNYFPAYRKGEFG